MDLETRTKRATVIIGEYNKNKNSGRQSIEEEVRRIANPLSASDCETDTSEYSIEDGMFDTTVREAATIARNGIMSRMFPFSSKWFGHKFTKTNEDEDNDRHERALERISDMQFRQLSQDNFYGAMSECLDDYLHLGTTNIRLRKGKRRFAHFQAVPKSTYRFVMDDEGFPDFVWSKYKMTAYEISTMFGDRALPEKIKIALDEDKPEEKFEVIHKISRRNNFKEVFPANPEEREYESVWVSISDKDIIGDTKFGKKAIYIGGEYDNIYTIGRLMSKAGQSEGDGLTTMMLPAIRTANQKAINIEKGQNLAADCPWYHDESNPLDEILPGSRIHRDGFNPDGAPAPVKLYLEGLQFEGSGLEEIRKSIREAYFNSAFKMFTNMDVATNRKTAFESRLIKSEQLSFLITLLYNLSEEVVKPLLSKHLSMMIREKKIPQSILDDMPKNYETELTSQFAKSIESTQAEDLMTALEMAMQIEQVAPGTARSTVKFNQAFRRVLRSLEIEIDDLYSEDESNELMKKELDMQAAMQQAAVANQGADAVSKLTQ